MSVGNRRQFTGIDRLRDMYIAIAIVSILVAASIAEEKIDFNRDVRPILSDKCYLCHGPDAENRQADLRLDVRDDAIDMIESGDVIARVFDDDEEVRMPPSESNLSLTAAEKQTLKKWVEAGAEYDIHWSFEPVAETVGVPEPQRADWSRQTIDRFVLSQLERNEQSPNMAAKPSRWLRRVTLDMTGLPPTPEEVAAFEELLKQGDEEIAYEQVVDRLLNSPAFGEHMAVAWLDAARYADSYGYQSDKLNTQWPYRDWVVRAFNDNLPYDQFITWQLAGDLLEAPTQDQKLATAFNRVHRLNNEGGAVFEEWRVENVADRVHTFGTAMLGLTLECCRCHDHKYDPIPTRDYYSMSAFFNSIDESGVYDRSEKVPCPSLLLPTPEQEASLADAKDTLRVAEAAYAKSVEQSRERFAAWEKNEGRELPIPDLQLGLAFDRPFENSLKEIYHPSQSDQAWTTAPELKPVVDCSIPRIDAQVVSDKLEDADKEPAAPRLALALDGERGITTHGIAALDRWTPFSVVVTMRETKRSELRSVIAHHTRGTDCGYNGWDLTIEDGFLESRMARVWPGNAMSVRTKKAVPADKWQQVTATYDGSSKATGLRLFLNGVELETEVLRDNVKKRANVKVDHGGKLVFGQRFRARGLDGGLFDDVRIYGRALTGEELRHLATGDAIETSQDYFAHAIDESVRTAKMKLTEARQALVMAEEVMAEIPIMQETAKPRPAYVLTRGSYDAPKNDETLVSRNTLSNIALPFPADVPRDRLGLAKWVTDPRHPLTSRVAVNRLWSNFFGQGLVRTPENFGLQGELPTHPKLLDWMARDFINSGWDVKRLCKQVVLSATYRQDSRVDRVTLEKDPDNRMLARGPAHRLSAEQIRDLALKASGILDETRGGPPVSPYQPGKDLWTESNGMSPPYKQSVGKALYRRSLYSIWKRTSPLPNMMALDATTREVCTVKRSRTNTPLQALVLLNDTQFVEAARLLAMRVRSEADDTARIQKAFVSFAGRRADDRELAVLTNLLDDERKFFQEHPDEAKQLVAIGESHAGVAEPGENDGEKPSVPQKEAIELAALTTVCQAILNLDATVWKR